MEDFANLLQRDYGFKPQGKMAPMSAAKGSSDAAGSTGQAGAMGKGKSSSRSARTSSSFSADDDLFFGAKPSGRPSYGASSEPSGGTYDDVFGGPPKFAPPKPSSSIPVYDDIFRTQPVPTAPPSSKDHSFPVFDSPYDDDIFLGVRGTRTAGVPYDNVFAGGAGASSSASPSEDLLGGYRSDQKLKSPSESHSFEASPTYDDELLPGLRSGYSRPSQQNERASFISVDGSSQSPAEVDPFAGIQPDPFSNISAMPSIPDPLDPFTGYPETKSANGIGDGIDGFDIFSQPSAKTSSNKKSSHPSKDRIYDTGIRETPEAKPVRRNYAAAPKQPEADIGREPALNDSSPKKKEQVHLDEDFSPAGDLNSEEFTEPPFHDMKESWITIDDVRLITDPTTALPPSRPAPGFTSDSETLNKESDHDKPSNVFDELEEFAAPGEFAPQEEEARTFSSSAAAMNEAIERTEAKLKRTREKEKARNEDKEEHEQRDEKEREEREKERQRRERDKERERDRAAVERATQEARDRAAIEARERAERAAVERATAEARERAAAEAKQRAAEKTAVERAAKEARQRAERAAVERANAEARERAERAAAERAATGRVTAEARERAAERAAVGRASAEARERAAAAAAAAAAREQQRGSDDLDNLFGARANSAPKQRPPTADFMTDTRPPKGYSGDRRSSTGAPVKKVSSVSGIDELTGLFGNSASSDFQEVEGETPDRRKARLERDRRTLERAQKALADKHQRDLNAQREQAEKHRVGEALDAEIRRWAAGKEGNLRALLSTLQYVLWPECGWQPVSLTDLITGASVKKVYRKATLCVHPDKVQQKGATVQQKYIAEKVFDMLKEAWNKLNAEELF